MIDINKNYRTKGGEEVRIYATDGSGWYPVHGAVKTAGGWRYVIWTNEGSLFFKDGSDPADLVEVVMIPEYWVVLFHDGGSPQLYHKEPQTNSDRTVVYHPAQEKPVTEE